MTVDGKTGFGQRKADKLKAPVVSDHGATPASHGQSAGLDLTAVVTAPTARQFSGIIFSLTILFCVGAGYFVAVALGLKW